MASCSTNWNRVVDNSSEISKRDQVEILRCGQPGMAFEAPPVDPLATGLFHIDHDAELVEYEWRRNPIRTLLNSNLSNRLPTLAANSNPSSASLIGNR